MRFFFSSVKFFSISCLTISLAFSANTNRIVNVYAWTGEIPEKIVRRFEQESGIKVNLSTYENNEIMYTKLRTAKNIGYDVIMPSSYFISRMQKEKLIQPLQLEKIPNRTHLAKEFLHPAYDPSGAYGVPFIWGITGIFVNTNLKDYYNITAWRDLWRDNLRDQIMLLDDSREVFSMALHALGYSANDPDANHIKEAFLLLKKIMPNVKVFSTETVVSILADEDAKVGMAWNGDVFKAFQENKSLRFVFPKEGYVIWVDNFSIPANAPHSNEAYAFINFMLKPEIAKEIALITRFPITNETGKKMLPDDIQNNKSIYPDASVLAKGEFQLEVLEETRALFEKYWEELKLAGG